MEKVVLLLGQVNSGGSLESECAGSWPGSACGRSALPGPRGGLEGPEAPGGCGCGLPRGGSGVASHLRDP